MMEAALYILPSVFTGLLLAWGYRELKQRMTLGQRLARLEKLYAELQQVTAEHREIHQATTEAVSAIRNEASGADVTRDIRDIKDEIGKLKMRNTLDS